VIGGGTGSSIFHIRGAGRRSANITAIVTVAMMAGLLDGRWRKLGAAAGDICNCLAALADEESW